MKEIKIEKLPVSSFIISDISGLDPVHVIMTDNYNGAGSLTITCYGSAWTCSWGTMGCFVNEFIRQAQTSYIANCLIRGQRHLITKELVLVQAERHIEKIVEAIKSALANLQD